ncbi:MAG: type IV secretion system DNA-binding domain-containing protein [Clostridia bacterium]|nr:type IV secretion system DNA-binding domain-containing protein [Clostridia bacterium]
MKKRFLFNLIFLLIFFIIGYFIFSPVYKLNSVYINYGLFPYDICQKQPQLWSAIKYIFIISCSINLIIISNFIFPKFNNLYSKKDNNLSFEKIDKNKLALLIGKNEKNNSIIIPEKGLYQNMIITGTIGSGKTSSAMYPFTKQLIYYKNDNSVEKIGMLILDVKGNYYFQVEKFCESFNRTEDLIIIELGGKYKYNPLNKPNLKASVLANRLKTILLLFSENNSESYWLDKAEQILEHSIKLCRLYNNNYVNFSEIHKLITDTSYYYEKINLLKDKFQNNYFNNNDCYDLLTSITFFENEFLKLDQRTMSILKSEITRITNCFISDYDVLHTFNPEKNEENFYGLNDILDKGKIVVLNMNISEYKNLSKIIAAYLKLDFQTEVLSNLAKNKISRTVAFISDEYHEYVTSTDADFFAQSREAKCINIVATQSYTSLLKTLNNESTVKVIIQNLINKIWLRTDDSFTIEEAQKQIGKEDKEKISRSISENAKETVYNYFTKSLNSKNSSITESINSVIQHDFIFDTNYFTQNLDTFNCIAFLSTGNSILPPQKIELIPYFKNDELYL